MLNFTREDVREHTDCMNAVNEGYKIFCEFNDRYMTFYLKKYKQKSETSKKIYSLQQFLFEFKAIKKTLD